ncbi:hypothetical protein TCAL_05813 [Tigriopus californicus]|uniref:ShKT domain-containing protein n=1 Tax=Tigriopus californicus TaxID=6832 RepID=A0A553PNI7_TIGCA|nr:uncharacterized protein LOC131881713 [Tigriopus californicus]TRY79251.1 hypothetical protein TCAL_05813 [Tigriopus californicus]
MQSIQLGIMFIAFLLRSCSSQVDFDANSFVEPVASTEIGRFCQNAIFISCQQVNVDLSAIRSGNTLTLPEGTQVQQKSLFPGSENNLVTAFYDSQDQKASLTITFSQDPDTVRVSGVIRVEDKVFNLVRCSLNNHACVALVEEEVKHLEDSGHELEDLEVPLERPVDRSTGTYQTDSDGNIIATVKVYFTLEFAKIELDIVGYVNNMIATANVGYMNSNIPFRLQLWCVELLEGVDESLLMPQLLPTLTTIKGDVTTLLDSADFAFVLLGERTDYCGRAYIGSLALPISIAQHSCAINSFSFGHEIGHNFGCRHNRESYQTGSSLPGYAFGYYFANAPFRTVLGKLVSGRTRINYFSNPNVSYQGHSTGTNASDCARQILENRIAYASIGSESQTCVTATIDGGWTEWSEWSCPAGCGQSAASQRTRDCINPPPLNGGSICQGPDFEMVNAPCSMPNACNCTNLRDNSYCEGFSWACQSTPSNVAIMLKNCRDTCNFCIDGIDGQWSVWSDDWSECNCATGTRSRKRVCNNPAPFQSGLYCLGNDTQTEACTGTNCSTWSTWGEWGDCQWPCGDSFRNRTRSCSTTESNCQGSSMEAKACNEAPCDPDCHDTYGWQWGRCEGIALRNWCSHFESTCHRTCGSCLWARPQCIDFFSNCEDAANPTACAGDLGTSMDSGCRDSCGLCPVNGGWSNWEEAGPCTDGTRLMTRTCTNPAPAHEGDFCLGNSTSIVPCAT